MVDFIKKQQYNKYHNNQNFKTDVIILKIRPSLKAAARFNPTKRTFQMTIEDICSEIDKQRLTLPLYQRDVSWTLQKHVDLFNYQLLGKAPVSPISINEIKDVDNCVAQVSFINRELVTTITPGHLSVADGQQRITTNYEAYKNSNRFRNIVLDLAKGKFVIVKETIKKYQIPVGILLNQDADEFFDYINTNSMLKKSDCMNILMQIRSKLRDYSYTINLATDLSEDEQIDWFEVLNNAGSVVSKIQMRFSKLKLDGIDIYVQYTNKFKTKIEEAGMELFNVKTTEVSSPIAALNSSYEVITEKEHSINFAPIPSDTKENQLCSLTGDQLRTCFKLTLDALDKSIEFIQNNSLKEPDRIDYVNYLVGLFVFKNNRELSEEENETLVEWYNNVNFTDKSNKLRRALFSDLLNLF